MDLRIGVKEAEKEGKMDRKGMERKEKLCG